MLVGLRQVVKDALVIVAASSALALAIIPFHPNAIPLVADQAYETLVPCPVSGGPAEPLAADDPALDGSAVFFVDARPADAFARSHADGAVSVPYDYLDPTPKEVLEALARDIARSGAQRLVVYGDGEEPDTGEELAKEISGFGIKNVHFVRGGAPALALEAAP
jgi:hypothetical protein